MRIRILRQTSISGQPARVGDVIDASPSDASTLLAMKKAVLVPEDPNPVVISDLEAKTPRPRKPRSI